MMIASAYSRVPMPDGHDDKSPSPKSTFPTEFVPSYHKGFQPRSYSPSVSTLTSSSSPSDSNPPSTETSPADKIDTRISALGSNLLKRLDHNFSPPPQDILSKSLPRNLEDPFDQDKKKWRRSLQQVRFAIDDQPPSSSAATSPLVLPPETFSRITRRTLLNFASTPPPPKPDPWFSTKPTCSTPPIPAPRAFESELQGHTSSHLGLHHPGNQEVNHLASTLDLDLGLGLDLDLDFKRDSAVEKRRAALEARAQIIDMHNQHHSSSSASTSQQQQQQAASHLQHTSSPSPNMSYTRDSLLGMGSTTNATSLLSAPMPLGLQVNPFMTNAYTLRYGLPQVVPTYSVPPSPTSRTLYLGNLPPNISLTEVLNHVRGGILESAKILPQKSCAFVTFIDANSANAFYQYAQATKLSMQGVVTKVGWGNPSSLPPNIAAAVAQGASRNVFLGNLAPVPTEDELREELGAYGLIEHVKVLQDKGIAFVHFANIANAMKTVLQLPSHEHWKGRRVNYGKDRCSMGVTGSQPQAPRRGSESVFTSNSFSPMVGQSPASTFGSPMFDFNATPSVDPYAATPGALPPSLVQHVNPQQNRTVYLGNIHPDTTTEDLCNVIRGGILHQIRYVKDKNHAFVSFVDASGAANFWYTATTQGLSLRNRKLKVGWGKVSPLPHSVALAVQSGASRNVYLGNLNLDLIDEDKLRRDFEGFGEIELVNVLKEKGCGFVNFTNVMSAIRAVEAIKTNEEYGGAGAKVGYGKDRCGNAQRGKNNSQTALSTPSGTPLQNPIHLPTTTLGHSAHSTPTQSARFSFTPASSGSVLNNRNSWMSGLSSPDTSSHHHQSMTPEIGSMGMGSPMNFGSGIANARFASPSPAAPRALPMMSPRGGMNISSMSNPGSSMMSPKSVMPSPSMGGLAGAGPTSSGSIGLGNVMSPSARSPGEGVILTMGTRVKRESPKEDFLPPLAPQR